MSISEQQIVMLLIVVVLACIGFYKLGVYEGWKTGWKDHMAFCENLKKEEEGEV